MATTFSALVVQRIDGQESPSVALETWSEDRLDEGLVDVEVCYSALNYKDALACQGHPGVAGKFPLIPGIDATGRVRRSQDERFAVGDEVLVAHAQFGTQHHGGLSQRVRVPADWVYRIPDGMTLLQAAAWGTAGFTAAHSVVALEAHDVRPDSGPIAVSGATGGVGSFAVALLSALGYEVHASTGKPDRAAWLRQLGATTIVDRQAWQDGSDRPLLKGQFAGVVDSVGGLTLATLLKSTQLGGCVTACGLVGGAELPTTVYPFILRGVTLAGIDSANLDHERRRQFWQRIASYPQIELNALVETVALADVPQVLQAMLAGTSAVRKVVDIQPESCADSESSKSASPADSGGA